MANIELFCNVGDYVFIRTYKHPVKAKIQRITIDEDGITYYTYGPILNYFSNKEIGVEVFNTKNECEKHCIANLGTKEINNE